MSVKLQVNIRKIIFTSGFLCKRVDLLLGSGICRLTGGNGSGKSSIIKSICGIQRFSGNCIVNGISLKKEPLYYKEQMGYCPDSYCFTDYISMRDYVSIYESCYKHKIDRESFDSAIDDLGIRKYMHSPISQLSFGTKKKLLLVSSLAPNPSLWVLDEPYDGLDGSSSEWLSEQIINRSERNIVVIADHTLPKRVSNKVDEIVSLD